MNAKAKDYIEPVKSKASETLQNVQGKVGETARNVSRATDEYVHDNPWKTVTIAAIAACLVGYLLGTLRES
ncbi:MAG: hypothetical protein JWQ71_4043 [Pedosphaera sp.]|nr:hypothetical protein [Pedosphaera sp.]